MIEGIAYFSILLGAFMILSGAIGVMRFPDFFTRCHAAGMTDAFGLPLLLLGTAMLLEPGLITLKIFILAVFALITSATASHALGKAALSDNIEPLEGEAARKACASPLDSVKS